MCSSFFQMAVPSVGVHYLLIPLSRLAMFSCVYTGMYGSESTQNIISIPQHPTISECTLDVHVSIVLFIYESPCMWILCTCGTYICDCIGVCNKCIHIHNNNIILLYVYLQVCVCVVVNRQYP